MSRPGLTSEILVSKFLYQSGWSEVRHDVICVGVQVDLIARAPEGHLCVVEVKSSHVMAHLSSAQRLRLERVVEALSQVEPVELLLAQVERSAQGLHVLLIPVED